MVAIDVMGMNTKNWKLDSVNELLSRTSNYLQNTEGYSQRRVDTQVMNSQNIVCVLGN